ncbi:MAG: Gfo/Idh/MocA family protein, partial [Pyrinomonadaceae bacterium]
MSMFVSKPVITDRKIRFALVGCGRISKNHFDALAKHTDRAELVAVCDVNSGALDAAVSRTGARGFLDLGALLTESDAEVIVLATPSGLHATQAIQIAGASRHVMTEKPMATR